MAKKFNEYAVDDDDENGSDFWNRRLRDIDNRIDTLEEGKVDADIALKAVLDLGVLRVNELITPTVNEAQALVDELQADVDANHVNRTDNPHAVSAEQVGTYTQAQIDAAIAAAKAEIVNSAGADLDTLGEAAARIEQAEADILVNIDDITALQAERVSTAEPQAFSDAGKLQARQNIYAAPASGLFFKSATDGCVLAKTGAGTATIAAGTAVEVGGTVVSFAVATAIVMPALTAGTDYAVYVCSDGTVRADASFSAPAGYTTANSRQVGGFHYAPGGHATGTTGGDTTPAINEYSLWDLKWRPACDDPRGMALVAGSFWCDIYLLGVDHHTNGTSKYNVTIADGATPPKIPTLFGGNGTTTYSTLNWWEAGEVLQSHGKQMLTYDEFAAAAYGTTEASSGGTDPVSTILREAYTSKWGVMLATGNLWVWGRSFGGGAAAAAWTANTGGRGSTYQMENAALWGGNWDNGANSGSRCSVWSVSPAASNGGFGARGRCDHLVLA